MAHNAGFLHGFQRRFLVLLGLERCVGTPGLTVKICVWQIVMKSTRNQLERELMREDVTRPQDLPSFKLLSP